MSTPETLSRRPSRPPLPPLVTGSALLHAGAVAALAAAPAAWPWICGAVFADHVALATAGLTPRSRLLGPNLTRVPQVSGGRSVFLTFDDGPDPEVTPQVLDRLDERGARATFFCIGERVLAHAELAAEIVRRGHGVENHSFSHPNLFSLYLNPALRREIARAQEVIAATTGRPPRLFRAPAGLRSFLLEGELHAAGLRLTSWTRRAFDTVDGDAVRVAARLARGLAAGDILVLHDGRGARTRGGRPVVLEALPRLLDEVAGHGLEAAPLRLA
jgi:peptidoglycan-N-acetylglucosamine deacetylase